MAMDTGRFPKADGWYQSLLDVSGCILETDNKKDGRPMAQPKFTSGLEAGTVAETIH